MNTTFRATRRLDTVSTDRKYQTQRECMEDGVSRTSILADDDTPTTSQVSIRSMASCRADERRQGALDPTETDMVKPHASEAVCRSEGAHRRKRPSHLCL